MSVRALTEPRHRTALRGRVRLAGCLLALVARAAAGIDAVPDGTEFQVNTYTDAYEGRPSVAVQPDGGFAVVWTGDAQDGSGRGVFAQSFDSAGKRRSEEFQVNVHTESMQEFPAGAIDADGNLVVVWTSFQQDGSPSGIFGRRFDGAGDPIGAEFQVNAYTTGPQGFPSVAVSSRGDFVAVWESYEQDGSALGLFGRRFASGGAALGPEFQVSVNTVGQQRSARVAAGADDAVVVVWASDGILGQVFDSSGARLGTEFLVSSGSGREPSIASDASGDFVVAWVMPDGGGSYTDILAQRFDLGAERIGTELRVNRYTIDFQCRPSVAVHASGGFAIAWQSRDQDGSGYGLFAQRFTGDADFLGSEFQISTFTANAQTYPSAGGGFDGSFVVAWQSHRDGNAYGIFARRFEAERPPTPTLTATRAPSPSPTAAPTSIGVPTATATPIQTPVGKGVDDDSCAIVRPEQASPGQSFAFLTIPWLLHWCGRGRRASAVIPASDSRSDKRTAAR